MNVLESRKVMGLRVLRHLKDGMLQVHQGMNGLNEVLHAQMRVAVRWPAQNHSAGAGAGAEAEATLYWEVAEEYQDRAWEEPRSSPPRRVGRKWWSCRSLPQKTKDWDTVAAMLQLPCAATK